MHTDPEFVEYDERKAASNLFKHGVSFAEAEQALRDPMALTSEYRDAKEEARFITIGCDAKGRLLLVITVVRSQSVRLVSARRASRGEAVGYGLFRSGR